MAELSLAEFKRRAAQCATFEVVNHRHPQRSGPRTVVAISDRRILAQRDGDDEPTHTRWPKAGAWRIEDSSITFLHDQTGVDCFTLTFPFDATPPAPRHPNAAAVTAVLVPASTEPRPLAELPKEAEDGTVTCCGAVWDTAGDWNHHAISARHFTSPA